MILIVRVEMLLRYCVITPLFVRASASPDAGFLYFLKHLPKKILLGFLHVGSELGEDPGEVLALDGRTARRVHVHLELAADEVRERRLAKTRGPPTGAGDRGPRRARAAARTKTLRLSTSLSLAYELLERCGRNRDFMPRLPRQRLGGDHAPALSGSTCGRTVAHKGDKLER